MAVTATSENQKDCPKCGKPMAVRNGKYGKFWGCTGFPRCRQTVKFNGNGNGTPEPVAPSFTPNAYQEAIFSFVEDVVKRGHLVVIAGAGTGKTTTIVSALSRVPVGLEVAFVAFNKKIATTLSKKAPSHVHVSTLHSLGFGNIRNALGKVEVNNFKVKNIIKDLLDLMGWEEAEKVEQSISQIVNLVSLLKANLMDPTVENILFCADRWNVELNGDQDAIVETTLKAYDRSVGDTTIIDYDDMIFFPASGRVPCKQFDVLFVDETQDLNAAQLEMAVRSIKPDTGRIVAVGDPNQSIYGFRGADAEAVPNIIARLNATTLPLSITYRVPKSGVELANTLVPELEAAQDAIEGVLDSISEYKFLDTVKPGDLVLCRTNAPLVKPCFSLIRQGVKAVILGRDIGAGLMALVTKIQKRYKVRSLEDTLESLSDYVRKERAKLLKAERTIQAELLTDKVETIFALADGCYTVAELERTVNRVFADDAEGVTFSSVHKAKGGEADRVFILEPQLMPHPKASEGWEMDQERNLIYVAITRFKKKLYFVNGSPRW